MLKGVIIGLLGGLLLVLGVTFYINDILLPVSELNSDTEDNHGTQNKKPRLSFYDSLLDDGDLTTKAVKRSSIDPPKLPKKYYLQVAAFRSGKEADNLKAKLALAGFASRIELSELEKDDIWYRVRLGPFKNETELWAVKTALSQHEFEANVVMSPN